MSIIKDENKHNIKCYDTENIQYVDTNELIKLKSIYKPHKVIDIIINIVSNSVGISDNATAMFKVITKALPRRGNITYKEAVSSCCTAIHKSELTCTRALNELIAVGIIGFNNREENTITITSPYNFTNIIDKDIKYIIIEC